MSTNRDKDIQREITAISQDIRARHPILRHQDGIGLSIFAISIAGVLTNAWLYTQGLMPAWLVIIGTALWTSLLHELEHDLIHWMYFRKNKWMHQVMMLGVYLARPTTINPWVRRHLHFHHHKVSGSVTDLEERGITNGEKWGLKRLLMLADNMLAVYLRPYNYLTEPRKLYRQGIITKADLLNYRKVGMFSYNPLGVTVYALWHFFLFYSVTNLIAGLLDLSVPWPNLVQQQMPWVTTLVVVLIAPNVLRSFCLHFISSNMHYYGDNEPGNITEQCQVLNAGWLLPLNLFCFNFGSTHAIHHFVVKDPFYIRQLCASRAHAVLRKYGVRFNDIGTFKRANRYHSFRTAVTPA